jgi:hypothetical protein
MAILHTDTSKNQPQVGSKKKNYEASFPSLVPIKIQKECAKAIESNQELSSALNQKFNHEKSDQAQIKITKTGKEGPFSVKKILSKEESAKLNFGEKNSFLNNLGSRFEMLKN